MAYTLHNIWFNITSCNWDMYITDQKNDLKKSTENNLKIVKQSGIWQRKCLILLLSAPMCTWTCNVTDMYVLVGTTK